MTVSTRGISANPDDQWDLTMSQEQRQGKLALIDLAFFKLGGFLILITALLEPVLFQTERSWPLVLIGIAVMGGRELFTTLLEFLIRGSGK